MYPALQAGNNVLVNKWIMGTRIFNIWDALEGKEVKIHRLPGDTLEIRNGFYRIRGIEEKLGKTTCGTGVLSTAKTGTGRKDGNGERAEGAIHGHQANEGGNKEITLIFLFVLNCINA